MCMATVDIIIDSASRVNAYFAVTAPGLEVLTAQELQRLNLLPPDTVAAAATVEPGGVAFQGDLEALYRANLHLRTASRVLVRVGDFSAAAFSELRKKASRLDWARYLVPGQPVAIRATCKASKLYHADAVAERIAGAIVDSLGAPIIRQKLGDEEGRSQHPEPLASLSRDISTPDRMSKCGERRDAQEPPSLYGTGCRERPPQLVVVHIFNNHCTVSVDASGELLHRRGYRQAVAKAPLRETLAAALLLAAPWDATSPLVDPFCGSGAIPIEAALLALGAAPGRQRRFAFMDWPGFDEKRWTALLAVAQASMRTELPPGCQIIASDRDAGAVRMAQENAARAGVAQHIQFTCQAVSAIHPPARSGWVITNPPYGIRVSSNKDLRNLYAQFGNVLRAQCPGWHIAILCNDQALLAQTRLTLDASFSLLNGGIKVRLARGLIKPSQYQK